MADKPKGNGAGAAAKELPIIRLDRLKLREQAHNIYFTIAPDGLKVADVLNPAVWSAVAFQLVAFDLIRVFFADENTWAELLVRAAQPTRAQLVLLRTADVGAAVQSEDDALPPGHRLFYDAASGWCIERTNADGSVVLMAKGSDHSNWDKRTAQRWIQDHATIKQSQPKRWGG